MEPFVPPDMNAPLDLEQRLAAIPDDAQVRGLFFRTARKTAEERGGRAPGRDSYATLTSYPTRELLEVLVECASLAYPGATPREGLRRLGQQVFPALRENPAGTFLFSVAGNNLGSAIRLIGKAYALFSSSRADLTEMEERRAVVQVRDAWSFPDCYHLGVIEGSFTTFHTQGEIRVRSLSLCDVDLELRWG